MRTLFVRTGGGARGVQLHAGAWMAMHRAGIQATACSGTSAGGLVSIADAGGLDAERFADQIRRLPVDAVKSPHSCWKLRAAASRTILGRRLVNEVESIHRPDAAKRVIAQVLPRNRYALSKTCHVWGVDNDTSERVDLIAPELGLDLHEAALATMSAPIFLPPFRKHGRTIVDGGIRYNCPLPEGWTETYDHVWIFVTSFPDRNQGTDLISRAQKTIGTLMWDQTADVLERRAVQSAAAVGRLHIVHLPEPDRPVGIFDFDPGAIAAGYTATRSYLLRRDLLQPRPGNPIAGTLPPS